MEQEIGDFILFSEDSRLVSVKQAPLAVCQYRCPTCEHVFTVEWDSYNPIAMYIYRCGECDQRGIIRIPFPEFEMVKEDVEEQDA